MKTETLKGILATIGSVLSSGAVGSALALLGKTPVGVGALVLEHGLPAIGNAVSTWAAETITVDQLRDAVGKTHRVEPFDLGAILDEEPGEAGP